jgi:hypothetical protein
VSIIVRVRVLTSVAACTVCLVAAGSARADEKAEPIRIDYDAEASCSSAASFAAEVFGRTSHAQAARAGEAARTLHVRIERSGDEEHVGTLSIEDDGVTSSTRRVRAPTCAEVAAALAMVAALSVDPLALAWPRQSLEPWPFAERDLDPWPFEPIVEGPSEPRAAISAASSTAMTAPAAGDRPMSAGARPREAADRAIVSAGARAAVTTVAGAVAAAGVFGDVDLGGALFAPAFRLGLSKSVEKEQSSSLGPAVLSWFVAEADVCLLRLGLAADVAARACAGFAGGVLDARGDRVAVAYATSRPWFSGSGFGRLAWTPLGWMMVEIEAGATFPFVREDFFFLPGAAVYEAPAYAFMGRAGIAYRFR